jgi:hypothetical protein
MIEATLDQTLVQPRPNLSGIHNVQQALEQFHEPVSFGEFIQRLEGATGAPRPEIEDLFWHLLNTGQAVLTPDLRVELRR